jgi:hypothetical protein
MAHPYSSHKATTVGKRRANLFKKDNPDAFARGGRAKHKPHVNINILSHGPGVSPLAPPMGPAAAGTSPPMLTPGGGPPSGVPGMKRGGAARNKPISNSDHPGYNSGISTKENLNKWAGYASRNSYRSGGAVNVRRGEDTPVKEGIGWSDRQGGTEKTTKHGGMFDKGRTAGRASGEGSLEYAKHMKPKYP